MNEEQPKQPETPQQSIYPDPKAMRQKWSDPAADPAAEKEQQYKQAATDFNDLIVLVTGVASSACLIGISYLLKSTWATVIVSSGLAAVSIFLAIRNYRSQRVLTPYTVIGLAAATVTIVYVGNILIANAIIRSSLNSIY